MATTPTALNQAKALFRQVARQGRDIAEAIERGQAVQPLVGSFDELLEKADAAPFTATVLGVDGGALATTLGWLCGHDCHLLLHEER